MTYAIRPSGAPPTAARVTRRATTLIVLAAGLLGAALTTLLHRWPGMPPALARLTVIGVAIDLVVSNPYHPSMLLAAVANAAVYALVAWGIVVVVRRR